MSETDDTTKPSPWGASSDTPSEPDKDTSSAAPEQVAPAEPTESTEHPETEDGVQAGGLAYTQLEDGFRHYPEQKPVETVDDPTPTPEQTSDASA